MLSILLEIKQLKPDAGELRKFSWTVGGAFLVLCGILAGLETFLGKAGFYPVLLWIGGLLIVVGTLVPPVVKPLYYAWMSLAIALGFMMTRVILTLFFFLVLTPVGLVFKLIGRDALSRKIDKSASTYWIDKEYLIPDRTRYEKYF